MASIKVRKNGSLLIVGDVELVDHEENPIEHKAERLALCRCGHSKNKPFCDGSHKEAGFDDSK